MGISHTLLICYSIIFVIYISGCSSEEAVAQPPLTYVSGTPLPQDPPLRESKTFSPFTTEESNPSLLNSSASSTLPANNDSHVLPNSTSSDNNIIAPEISTSSPILNNNSQFINNLTPWAIKYEQIEQQASQLHLTPLDLAQRSEELLQNQTPTEPIHENRCMTLAVISAAGYYWADEIEKANTMAQKVFQYRNDHIVVFPNTWKLKEWHQKYGLDSATKLAQAKDFILAANNAGADLMAEANRALLARAKFLDAMEMYRRSLEHGVQDSELRHAGYLRFAGCLFKASRMEEAEETFLHAWLLSHDLEMDFGDIETRTFINGLSKKYSE